MESNMDNLLRQVKYFYSEAEKKFKPRAVIGLFSGGDDSLAMLHACRQQGIKLDGVIHGNTRTGIPETNKFAVKEIERTGNRLLYADAGDSYVNYVLRKGFFGKGKFAHSFSYHALKAQWFRKVISAEVRKRKRNYPILFVNGVRRQESAVREKTMREPISIRGTNDIWVNVLNEWGNREPINFLEGSGIKRNPVSVALCSSRECMCGTTQSEGDRVEAGLYDKAWKRWMDELELHVKKIHGWGWGEQGPTKKKPKSFFQPGCEECVVRKIKSS